MEPQEIKSALQRAEHVFNKRPEMARMKKVSTATVQGGTRCEFREDQWSFTADMPAPLGGTDTGPNPGTFIRAGLTACLAIGYSMRAAYLGIPVRGIEVQLLADVDNRGIFCGQAQVPTYNDLACVVTIDSDAPEADLQRLLDEADDRSPYLNLFRTPQKVRREMQIRRTAVLA